MSLSQVYVSKLYASVIEDVITGVREYFTDEGVDEQVLQELKHSWETRLRNTKAVEQEKEKETVPIHINPSRPSVVMEGAASGTDYKVIQLQQGDNQQRLITVQVPVSLQGNQLQTVLNNPLIAATMALPPHLASSLLQQHVTAAFHGQNAGMVPLQAQTVAATTSTPTQPTQTSQTNHFNQGELPQTDGVRDSSDEEENEEEENEDELDEEDDEEEEEKDEEDDAEEQTGVEEDPLNSGDDVSEADVTEMFETDNVVVCQYDKITRSRNKWKFYLKDGIMNLDGKDFVFQKSCGDAEW